MSIQEQLSRIQEAKTAIRQTIISKGVEVPESAKINEYSDYIAQIATGGTLPDTPDLTKQLTVWDLADIKAIVAAGVAEQRFELGQTLLVKYDIYTMPFEIVGFNDVTAQIDGEEKMVHALNLLAQYAGTGNMAWSSSANTPYSTSTLRENIVGNESYKLDSYFLDCLANTKVQTYNQDGSTDTVYDKLFAPSIAQLGATNPTYYTAEQAAVEGPAFTTYQDADDAKRVKYAVNSVSARRAYWTRSMSQKQSSSRGRISLDGSLNWTSYGGTAYPVLVCNLIG